MISSLSYLYIIYMYIYYIQYKSFVPFPRDTQVFPRPGGVWGSGTERGS